MQQKVGAAAEIQSSSMQKNKSVRKKAEREHAATVRKKAGGDSNRVN